MVIKRVRSLKLEMLEVDLTIAAGYGDTKGVHLCQACETLVLCKVREIMLAETEKFDSLG